MSTFLIFPNNVSGYEADTWYIEDFEDEANGNSPIEGWLWGIEEITTANVYNNQFRILPDGDTTQPSASWQFLYPNPLAINHINWTQRADDDDTAILYLNFTDFLGDDLFKLRTRQTGQLGDTIKWYIGIYDFETTLYDDIFAEFLTDGSDGDYSYIDMEILYSNHTIKLQIYDITASVLYTRWLVNPDYFSLGFKTDNRTIRFLEFFMETDAGSDDPDIFDDFKIQFDTDYDYSPDYSDMYPFDIAGLIKVGHLQETVPYYSDSFMHISDTETTSYAWWDILKIYPSVEYNYYQYLETQYDTEIEGTIKHFAFKMPKIWQDTYNGDYTDLFLRLNGYYCDQATGSYSLSLFYDMLFWENVDVPVSTTGVNIEILSANQPDRYILVDADTNIYGDTTKQFRVHGDNSLWNGYYDGGNVFGTDFVNAFWYKPINYEEGLEEYNFSIGVSESVVYQGESIDIVYSCPITDEVFLTIDDNGIIIYNKSTDVTGITSGFMTFLCENSGYVNISLRVDNVVQVFQNVTVIEKDINYLIYTTPNPSKPNQEFDICYIYNNTLYDGVIEINDVQYNIDNSTANLTKIYDINILEEGCYNIILYINKDGTLIEKANNIHTVKNNYANDIYLSFLTEAGAWVDYYEQNVTFSFLANMYIKGKHNFICKDIFVYVGGHTISVSTESIFSEQLPHLTRGSYTAYLKIRVGASTIILDSISFSISGEAVPSEPDFLFGLPMTYMYAMFGALITLGFLVIPFSLSMKHKGSTSSVIYAIFGGIGLGVATIIGFFPLWLPLMITIIVVTILVVEYKKG